MSGETIIITRPKGDEIALTEALQARGYHVIHEPLTEIFLHHHERQALHHALLDEPDAVIVTSRHGAQALALLSDVRDTYVLCVGEATAETAHSLGFTRVGTAGGNVRSLIDIIAQSYDAGSRFLYVSGKHSRVDLEAELRAHHMEVKRVILYEAIAVPGLSDTLIEQLRRKQIDAITFFSPRTAQLFIALLGNAGVMQTTAHLHAFCLSTAITEPLLENAWRAIHIADEATLASMVREVDNIFHGR